MRALLTILVVVATALTTVSPGAAMSPPSADPGATSYTVLQMNLCLSGRAGCYPQTRYPLVVDEAAAQVRQDRPSAVTLNEACSGDAAAIARRAGYRMSFAPILMEGAWLPCVEPTGRGVFGLAVLSRERLRTSLSRAFGVHTGVEERRWLCATTAGAIHLCTAHLSTRTTADERAANDAECHELRGVLERYGESGTIVFGGDVNRRGSCAPARMWTTSDSGARQSPGIQQVYVSKSLDQPSTRVAAATYTDHDFLLATGNLGAAVPEQ